MSKTLGIAAYAAGLAVLAWVGAGYASSSPLALLMTLLIAAVYGLGGLELQRFHQATAGLQQALLAPADGLPTTLPATLAELGHWLQQLHPSLQNPVRLRIEGERMGLPGPALAPSLVGLLVLLGMLGTFLGMVATLRGAALALQTSTDLATVRAALTAPVQGLGLAFGTSVAGVAASAMLGLVAALCRRDRLLASQLLDSRIATGLRQFSQAHQRELTLHTLQTLQQQQASTMPALVDQVQAAMAQLTQQGQALATQLLANQQGFHHTAQASHGGLAAAVEQSLKTSLAESARLAGATITPLVQATMAGITRETSALHGHIASTVQAQLDGLSQRFDSSVQQAAHTWQAALDQQQHSSAALSSGLQATQAAWSQRLAEQSSALLAQVDQAQQRLLAELAARDQQRLATLVQPLQAMAGDLRDAWQQAGVQTLRQQEALCQTLETSARNLHSQAAAQASQTQHDVAKLLQAAGEAPRAAAEAMAALRQQLSDSLQRDQQLLDERNQTMATLHSLLQAVQQASTDQRLAIDQLVHAAASMLRQAGEGFSAQAAAGSGKLAEAATEVAAGAVDVARLGDSFGTAVAQFSSSNQALMGQLQRIEAALSKSLQRSDEQLAYYVAQARELIDLSLLSQQQIVDELRQATARPLPKTTEAA